MENNMNKGRRRITFVFFFELALTVRSGMAFVVSRAQRTLLSPSTVAAIVSSCRFVSFRSQALKTQHERAKQCERERERERWSASNFESSQCSSGC